MPEYGAAPAGNKITEKAAATKTSTFSWMELLKVVALPLVTLILGFWFNKSLNERQARDNVALNERQARDSDLRLYTEMMGRREQADSDLRKDMFKSILDTFMSTKDRPTLEQKQQLKQDVLKLELLAYNFHESLDIGPLFKEVRSRIPEQKQGPNADLRRRLERVAQEVIQRQLTLLSDSAVVEKGSAADPQKINDLQTFLFFDGPHVVPDPSVKAGEGVSRLCLSIESAEEAGDKAPHYRQFTLEVIKYDPLTREVRVRLYASQLLTQRECQQADLDLAAKPEIDTNFWVGLFDFPMIDNTRLSHDERCAVSLTDLSRDVITVALAYFPGSRASLKDKPYYDEVIRRLVPTKNGGGILPGKHGGHGGTP